MTCPSWVPPTAAQFKAQFFRDFAYAPIGDASLKYVQDQDITNAITLANVDFNADLFGTNADIIFLYLAAHYMIENLRASSMGLNSQAQFMLESSSVGGVSIVNNISDWVASSPQLAKYMRTKHGQIYLDLAFPYTIGAGIGISIGTIGSS